MGKVEFTILANEFGISHVIKKCLCAMFGLQSNIVHISKDDAYDDNYNVTKSIYQVLVNVNQWLEWTFNGERFRIVGENQLKSSQDIVFTLSTTTSITNDVLCPSEARIDCQCTRSSILIKMTNDF